METLTRDNAEQAIIPASWEQIEQELPETVAAIVLGAMTGAPANMNDLPVWYVLTKASGVTGIPLQRLYDCPIERRHAIAVLAVDSAAANKLQAEQK